MSRAARIDSATAARRGAAEIIIEFAGPRGVRSMGLRDVFADTTRTELLDAPRGVSAETARELLVSVATSTPVKPVAELSPAQLELLIGRLNDWSV